MDWLSDPQIWGQVSDADDAGDRAGDRQPRRVAVLVGRAWAEHQALARRLELACARAWSMPPSW
jgi:hypothetical protein